jgi:hypothetical protein
MESNRVAACVETVRGGHDHVLHASSSLRSWWEGCRGETTTPFEELSRRLLELRDLLRAHFRDEESADQTLGTDDLVEPSNNRAVLLADVNQLISRLRVCQPGMDCWADAEQAIDRFFVKLDAHEDREMATLPYDE